MHTDYSLGLTVFGPIFIAGSLLLVLDVLGRIVGMIFIFLRSRAARHIGKSDKDAIRGPADTLAAMRIAKKENSTPGSSRSFAATRHEPLAHSGGQCR